MIAFLIYSSVEQLISRIVVGVTLPALSEIARERTAELRRNYYRVYAGVASFAYASAGFLTVAGYTIIQLLYDHRYSEAGWMLQILSIGLIAIPSQVLAQCFIALGKPQISFWIMVVRCVTLFVAVPIGFYWQGLEGALIGIVISRFMCVPFLFFLVGDIVSLILESSCCYFHWSRLAW